MADTKISQELTAPFLDGTELTEIVQAGNNRKTTTQEIANLATLDLASVAISGSANDLGTGTLPNARLSGVPNSALANGTLTLSISGNTTLSGNQANNNGFEFGGALSGDTTITWPSFYGFAAIQNHTTGGFPISCGVSGGVFVAVQNGETAAVWSDGTNFIRLGPVAAFAPEQFGAKGDGVSDDTAAFQAMAQAINKAGCGVVSLRAGAIYFVCPPGWLGSNTDVPVMYLTSPLSYFEWYGNGASFLVGQSFASPPLSGAFIDLLLIAPSSGTTRNVRIYDFSVTQVTAVSFAEPVSGVRAITLGNNVIDVEIFNPTSIGTCSCVGIDGVNHTSRAITVIGGSATDCWYGVFAANNGDDMTVRSFFCTGCFRDYFVYGVNNHDISITSQNSICNTILVEGVSQSPTTNLRINCNCLVRTVGGKPVSYLTLDLAAYGSDNTVIRGIDATVTYDASGDNGPADGGYAVMVTKGTTASTGSVLDDVRIRVNVVNAEIPSNYIICICDAVSAPWSGEFISNMEISGTVTGVNSSVCYIDAAAFSVLSPLVVRDFVFCGTLNLLNGTNVDFIRCSFDGGSISPAYVPTDQSGAGLTFAETEVAIYRQDEIVMVAGLIEWPTTSDTHVACISLPVSVPNRPGALLPGTLLQASGIPAVIFPVQNTATAKFFATGTESGLTNAELSGQTVWFNLIYPSR